jgi:hypothetical protein
MGSLSVLSWNPPVLWGLKKTWTDGSWILNFILFYFIFPKTVTNGSLILKHYAKIETYDIIHKTKYIDTHPTLVGRSWYGHLANMVYTH